MTRTCLFCRGNLEKSTYKHLSQILVFWKDFFMFIRLECLMYDYIFMLCFCYFCSFLSELDSATLTALDIDLEMEIAPEAVQ